MYVHEVLFAGARKDLLVVETKLQIEHYSFGKSEKVWFHKNWVNTAVSDDYWSKEVFLVDKKLPNSSVLESISTKAMATWVIEIGILR